LAELSRRHNLLLIDDVGSGALFDTAQFGLASEPTVQASLKTGADLVMFSGDKLLGGPQAGILVGRANVIDRIKRNPLARAVRADKVCLAGLSATLTHYLKDEALTRIPVWRMISTSFEELQERATRWGNQLVQGGVDCEVIKGQSTIGGGSLPGGSLPTALLAILVPSPDRAAARLRSNELPVVVRRQDDRLVIDPRTVLERDEAELLAALESHLKSSVRNQH
jgi:L-seryl-tRNA(Ser) seleniumtransferase